MISKLNKKAGMELSMTTIVVLIVSIITFGFAITLALNLFGAGQDKANLAFEDYERQKFDIACSGQKVCVETSTSVGLGEDAVIRMRVNNVLDTDAIFNTKIDVVESNAPATHTQILSQSTSFDINNYKLTSGASTDKAIVFDTSKNFKKGQYQIEVVVNSGDTTPNTEYFKKFIYLYVK